MSKAFEQWWEEFTSAHDEWRFADSDALRKAAWNAALEHAAKVCERLISGDGICADDGVWIHDCAEAIRKEKTE